MANVLYYPTNSVNNETLIATTGAVNYGVERLQQRSPATTWRSTSLLAQSVKFNGTAVPMRNVTLLGANFTAAATVELRGSDDDFSTTPFTETLIQGSAVGKTTQWTWYQDAAATYDDWMFYVNDPTNPAAYLECGVWFLGGTGVWEPDVGISNASGGMQAQPNSTLNVTRGGQVYPIYNDDIYGMQHTFTYIEDREGFLQMRATTRQGAKELLIQEKKYGGAAYTEDAENFSHYVRYAPGPMVGIAGDKWSASITVIEQK